MYDTVFQEIEKSGLQVHEVQQSALWVGALAFGESIFGRSESLFPECESPYRCILPTCNLLYVILLNKFLKKCIETNSFLDNNQKCRYLSQSDRKSFWSTEVGLTMRQDRLSGIFPFPQPVSAEQYFFGNGLVNASAAVRKARR